MVKPNDVIEKIKDDLLPLHVNERDRLKRLDRWYRWDHPFAHTPRNATPELKKLIELSRTPWLGLVVSVVSQTMFCDGYRSPDERANSAAWRTWLGNGFNARQIAIHRAALAYGYAFATAFPGVGPDGKAMAAMRGVSPVHMVAVYADPAEDEWPMYALRIIPQPGRKAHFRFIDEEAVHYVTGDRDGDGLTYLEARPHGAGVPPVVRYANQLDLEGRAVGEVEPFIPLAGRINKTDYDRMLTQHFASWKVRYATGMAKPDGDTETAAAEKMRLRHEDFLVAEDPDTKFGVLDASDLTQFNAAHDSDVETLAAVSQTPTTAFGKLTNLSAEALASARAQLDQKVAERKASMGESHAQLLRMGAYLEGNDAAAVDFSSRMSWQDMSIRSMAQAVDALGKAATMLQIPVEALWPMVPGVTKPDVDDWKRMRAEGDPIAALNAHLLGGDPAAA